MAFVPIVLLWLLYLIDWILSKGMFKDASMCGHRMLQWRLKNVLSVDTNFRTKENLKITTVKGLRGQV